MDSTSSALDPSPDSTTPEPAARLWTRETAPFILSALALMSLIAVEAFAVTTVLPVAMADLEATSWYSLAFAATIATGLTGMVVGGTWSDRSGPRPPLLVGGALFLAGLVLCAAAPGPALFILGRVLQGIGGGIDSVVLYVLIARLIPAAARPAMFGLLTTAWLLPSLVGPVGAGLLAQLTTWRTVFVVILVGSALALAGLLRSARAAGGSGAGRRVHRTRRPRRGSSADPRCWPSPPRACCSCCTSRRSCRAWSPRRRSCSGSEACSRWRAACCPQGPSACAAPPSRWWCCAQASACSPWSPTPTSPSTCRPIAG